MISAVVLTANRRALLAECLGALARQALVPDEVVVIDNGSADGTREWLARAAESMPFAVRVASGPGRSFAEARNAGVRLAAGDTVAFIDDDCEADALWLERMAAALDANGWEAAGGAVYPATLLEAPEGYTPELAWLTGCTPPGFLGPLSGRLYLPATANLVARKALLAEIPFQRIGGRFAKRKYDTGREDAQWWRRVRRSGRRCGTVPRAIVWHHIGSERLDTATIAKRAEADGRAFWKRERLRDEVAAAARDLVWAPVHAARDATAPGATLREAVQPHAVWARRQWAFLRAAASDANHGISPQRRLGALLGEAGRMVLSGARAGVRSLALMARDVAREPRPFPTAGDPPAHLMIVLHDFLGDAVLAMPLVRQAAEGLEESQVTILTGPVCAPMLRANVPEGVRVELAAAGAMALHEQLRRLAPDAIVIAYCHGLPAAPLFAAGAPVAGWREDNGLRQRLWGDLLDAPVEKNFKKAEAAALLDLAGPLGLKTRLERPRLRFSDAARSRREAICAKAGLPEYAVLHVEGDGRWKIWPVARQAEFAARLGERLPVVLVGALKDQAAAEAVMERAPRAINLLGLLDTDELAAVCAGARLFAGCDSGPAHVAQAVGTPTLVLMGMTEPHRWGPMPPLPGEEPHPHRVLAGAPGDGLVEEGRGLPPNWGMLPISVAMALDAADAMLATSAAPTNTVGR